MYKERRIAVVVPAYNEARHVGGVLAAVPAYVDHVIAVDDCSTDETASVIASAAETSASLESAERPSRPSSTPSASSTKHVSQSPSRARTS